MNKTFSILDKLEILHALISAPLIIVVGMQALTGRHSRHAEIPETMVSAMPMLGRIKKGQRGDGHMRTWGLRINAFTLELPSEVLLLVKIILAALMKFPRSFGRKAGMILRA